MISPWYVLSQFSSFTIRKVGTINTSIGSINVARIAMKARSSRRTGTSRAQTGKGRRSTLMIVTESETMMLLVK